MVTAMNRPCFSCFVKTFFCLALAVSAAAAPPRAVHFTTTDGVIIAGAFSAPSRKGLPTLILLHGLGSGRGEWDPFAARLKTEGYGVLAYDLRGHGESTGTVKGRSINYRDFGAPGPGSQWDRMTGDLDGAVAFLRGQGIPAGSIRLCGASLGANISLIYAARNRDIRKALLLSPGINYAGLDISSAAAEYGARPLGIAASNNDRYAYLSSGAVVRAMKANRSVVFMEGPGGHGVQMFDGKFEKKLIEWITAP